MPTGANSEAQARNAISSDIRMNSDPVDIHRQRVFMGIGICTY